MRLAALLAAGELHTGHDDTDDAMLLDDTPAASPAEARLLTGMARLGALVRERGIEPAERLEFHLLPENVPVLRLWGEVQTQWSHGPMGPTGFNWASLRAHPAVAAVPRAERAEVLAGLATMERAWLAKCAEIREANAKQREGLH